MLAIVNGFIVVYIVPSVRKMYSVCVCVWVSLGYLGLHQSFIVDSAELIKHE